ncbi:MAG: hypothetical protein KKE02_21185 [Alphaproteobacteria bacterium]|nr:hypothetical protein [Alphaproteobacteria bacterium]MBU1516206.1 hypothetical protein [Alphaproteobacteria bacterium]MBU2093516.1 hypothetical protein [Alphaproteobacteria bacterium]MBU2153546.1 hypothetical protein [Alphaproteobacteria bacterium]MBU2308178.1 hypothetical protein [Alphaproteobacteria bacterium]
MAQHYLIEATRLSRPLGLRVPLNKCPNCDVENALHEHLCECGWSLGYPNVRQALQADEIAALHARTNSAAKAAISLGTQLQLAAFTDHVRKSVAVVGRDIGTLDSLSRSDSNFYVSFHRQVRAGVRAPKDNQWDKIRPQVDAAMFPYYESEILFALLSLDDVGDTHYGTFFITLKDRMIELRASVFESNSLEFAEKRGFRLAAPVPAGYRATWAARHELAMAKLHKQIGPATKPEDHQNILLDLSGATAEFIEVHIFGKLGISSIAKVTGVTPMSREDKALWKSVRARLEKRGIDVQER